MSKIGTAHVEIKPVMNHEALDAMIAELVTTVEQAVSAAVDAALAKSLGGVRIRQTPDTTTWPTLGGPHITC